MSGLDAAGRGNCYFYRVRTAGFLPGLRLAGLLGVAFGIHLEALFTFFRTEIIGVLLVIGASGGGVVIHLAAADWVNRHGCSPASAFWQAGCDLAAGRSPISLASVGLLPGMKNAIPGAASAGACHFF